MPMLLRFGLYDPDRHEAAVSTISSPAAVDGFCLVGGFAFRVPAARATPSSSTRLRWRKKQAKLSKRILFLSRTRAGIQLVARGPPPVQLCIRNSGISSHRIGPLYGLSDLGWSTMDNLISFLIAAVIITAFPALLSSARKEESRRDEVCGGKRQAALGWPAVSASAYRQYTTALAAPPAPWSARKAMC